MTARSRNRKLRKALKNKENTDVRPYPLLRPEDSRGIKGLRPRIVTTDEWLGSEAPAVGEPPRAGGDHDPAEGGRGNQPEARLVRQGSERPSEVFSRLFPAVIPLTEEEQRRIELEWRPRTYAEQRALYEKWKGERKDDRPAGTSIHRTEPSLHRHFFEREVNGLPEHYATTTCVCPIGHDHWTNKGEN